MAVWKEWANRFRYLRHRQRARVDDDLEQEISFHRDARIAELEASGLTHREARAQVDRELGSLIRMREDTRAAWQFRWLEDAFADLRYALRTFRRSPAFVLTAVLSLALGMGATSAIFTALDAVIWRPLPVADAGSLAVCSIVRENGDDSEALPLPFVTQLRQAGIFSDLIATSADGLSFSYDGRAERILGEVVSGNYFTFLGVQPILGQGFSSAVQRGDWAPEVVLSHGFWTRRFAADPGVIGRTIRLNTVSFTIVGVSPPGFFGLIRGSDYDVRLPLLPEGRTLEQMALIGGGSGRWLYAVARLAPGMTLAQAEAAADVQLQDFRRTTAIQRLRERTVGHMRVVYGGNGDAGNLQPFHATLYTLLILAMTVLVIACVNVASLLLARATARARELAVRLSIGAGRFRLIRQMLTESALLSLLGGIVAMGVASWSAGLLALFVPQGHISIALDLRPDSRVLLFTCVVSVLTTFGFGLLPALQATRGDVASALKADAVGAAGARHSTRTRAVLVMSQVAFSIVLLMATGVFVRTLADLRPEDYRADPNRVLLFTMKPQTELYTQARKLTLAAELLRRVSQQTGVQSAALAEYGPLGSRTSTDNLQVPGHTIEAQTDWVTPGFFETIGMPRVAGRDFTMNDRPGSPFVAIVNRSLARVLFDDEQPIGRIMQFVDDRQHRQFEIVGVVADTHYYDVHKAPGPAAWFAFQGDGDLYMPTLHVRSATTDSAGLVTAIRREFDQLDRGFPVFNIKTLEVRVEESLSQERMIANISAGFGILALALAAVGLYGILAYSVARRTREIGIRMALGSSAGSIIAMVAREGLLLVATGSIVGILIAIAGSRVLSRYLPGVSSLDLPTVAACAATMLVIALAAVCVPAVRACRVDPLTALRQS
jgi:macrolide transport system ATP-binding/permease protein